MKKKLKVFHRQKCAGMHRRVQQAHDELKLIQEGIFANPDDSTLLKEEGTKLEKYKLLLKYERMFLMQKSKVDWTMNGDEKNAFFYARIRARRNKAQIGAIQGDNGQLVTSPDLIAEFFVSYYQNLLGNVGQGGVICPELLEPGPTITSQQCMMLVQEVTAQEIKATIFNMPRCKSPGPDGYTMEFFKHSWDIVGEHVVKGIKHFFSTGYMLQELNNTCIALVPKIDCPSRPVDFRPISCCNVLYKCIASIITSRLKEVTSGLVGNQQAAFIKGRSIVHNIMLAQEILCGYGRANISPRCTMKIYLFKAYDTVNWDFLQSAFVFYGFPLKFIEWIMACVCSPSFSVLVNGELKGFFRGKRGLRQGDPMSPYLFCLCMEIFSRMLGLAVKRQMFKFHPRCKELKLTHLMYADDLLMFSKCDLRSIKLLQDVLDKFAEISGLNMNLHKSHIYFGGCSQVQRMEVCNFMNVEEGSLPFSYLGVPLTSTKPKVSDFRSLIHHITRRITSWTSRFLSFAGRLELIQSVIYSVQNFWSSIFILPKAVLHEIESICMRYLWSSLTEGTRKYPVSWKVVCRPKQAGGLGLMDLFLLNISLMLKLFWDIVLNKESLWVKWVHSIYIKNLDLWTMEVKSSFTWSIKAILKLRDRASACVSQVDKQWILPGIPFSAPATYAAFSPSFPNIWWSFGLWNKYTLKKCSFSAWFAFHNRLYTKDRLKLWNLIDDATCCLCGFGSLWL